MFKWMRIWALGVDLHYDDRPQDVAHTCENTCEVPIPIMNDSNFFLNTVAHISVVRLDMGSLKNLMISH